MAIRSLRIGRLAFVAATLLWLTTAIGGLAYLWAYAANAGDGGSAPDRWPAGSAIALSKERPTLVVFAHPRCPCTQATIGELAKLTAQCQGQVDVRVAFVTPREATDDWRSTDLWDAALAIPGVDAICDECGTEASRFSVATSGHAVLYAADGHLLYSGGLTAARGHAGDNAGCTAIKSLLTQSDSVSHHEPVFGCELFGDAPQPEAGAKSCCPK